MFVIQRTFTYNICMRMIALLAVCGVMALTQAPATQPLPRHLIEEQQNNWNYSLFIIERTMTVSAENFNASDGYVAWQPHQNRSTRTHTRTNAVRTELVGNTYTYYFDPAEDIEIYDRRPNTPIWYGIAVAVTAIAMITFYLIVKKKKSSQAGE